MERTQGLKGCPNFHTARSPAHAGHGDLSPPPSSFQKSEARSPLLRSYALVLSCRLKDKCSSPRQAPVNPSSTAVLNSSTLT